MVSLLNITSRLMLEIATGLDTVMGEAGDGEDIPDLDLMLPLHSRQHPLLQSPHGAGQHRVGLHPPEHPHPSQVQVEHAV